MIYRCAALFLFWVVPWLGAEEEVAVLHTNLRTGRDILVSADTPAETAATWLEELAAAWLAKYPAPPDDEAAERFHQLHAREGLKARNSDVLLAENTVITQYTDPVWGRTIWVIGGTPLSSAAAWMRVVREAKNVDPLKALVREHHGSGLLACTITVEDTKSTVVWGTIVGKDEPAAPEGPAPNFDKLGEWMNAINAAKTEADMVEVVRANHAEGLSTASGLTVREGDLDLGVTVLWVTRGLLGRVEN